MEAESTVDEVTVVEASLTVVLDIIHPPWDLEDTQQQGSRVRTAGGGETSTGINSR